MNISANDASYFLSLLYNNKLNSFNNSYQYSTKIAIKEISDKELIYNIVVIATKENKIDGITGKKLTIKKDTLFKMCREYFDKSINIKTM